MKNIKKIFFLLLLSSSIISACDYGPVDEDNIIIQSMYNYNFENNIIEKYELKNIYDIMKFVAFYIKYIPDDGKDYEQTPEETYKRRNENNKMLGDCEDHSGMFAYLADQIGIKTEIIISYDVKASKKAGKNKYHAFIYCPENDLFIETVDGDYMSYDIIQKEFPIIHSIPWSEYIWMVYNYHKLVGKYIL